MKKYRCNTFPSGIVVNIELKFALLKGLIASPFFICYILDVVKRSICINFLFDFSAPALAPPCRGGFYCKTNGPLSHCGPFKPIESIGKTITKDLSEYAFIIASAYKIVKLVSTKTQPPFIFLGANLPGIERPLLKSSTVYLFLVKNDISFSDK